mgnify:CR=1 FL=1
MKLNNKKTLGFTLIFLIVIVVICFFMMDWTKNNSSDEIHSTPNLLENDSLAIKEDTVVVETFFNKDDDVKIKNSNVKIDLLKEIGFCNSKKCPTNLFRILPLNTTDSLSNAFFLIVKAGVNDSPTRKVYVFKRIKSKLALLNVFNGNLIQLIRKNSGYNDIVVHFGSFGTEVIRDGGKFLYDCLFKWNGEKYQYSSCEKINDSKIKPMYRDSISKDTYYYLKSKKYFKD